MVSKQAECKVNLTRGCKKWLCIIFFFFHYSCGKGGYVSVLMKVRIYWGTSRTAPQYWTYLQVQSRLTLSKSSNSKSLLNRRKKLVLSLIRIFLLFILLVSSIFFSQKMEKFKEFGQTLKGGKKMKISNIIIKKIRKG